MTWLSTAHLSVISITPMCILHDVFTTVGDYSLSILLFEIHHRGWFSLFSIHFVKQQKVAKASFHTVHRVVRKKLNFGLRVCRIFSCENTIKYKTYYDDRMDTSAQNMSTKLIGLTHITSIQMSLSFDCCGIDQQFRITPLIHTT